MGPRWSCPLGFVRGRGLIVWVVSMRSPKLVSLLFICRISMSRNVAYLGPLWRSDILFQTSATWWVLAFIDTPSPCQCLFPVVGCIEWIRFFSTIGIILKRQHSPFTSKVVVSFIASSTMLLSRSGRDIIWSVRIQEIQSNVIDHLPQLTIWNAGKQVRKQTAIFTNDYDGGWC